MITYTQQFQPEQGINSNRSIPNPSNVKRTPDVDALFADALSFYKISRYPNAVDSFDQVLQISRKSYRS